MLESLTIGRVGSRKHHESGEKDRPEKTESDLGEYLKMPVRPEDLILCKYN